MWIQARGRTAQPKFRPRRGWRPDAILALEGRALLATSALDPTFGTSGAVLSPLTKDATNVSSPSAVGALVVQSDGKIITAETQVASGSSSDSTVTPLVVRRYNANGTLDTTFGTGGSTTIPFPATGSLVAQTPRDLAIQADGSIVLVDEALNPSNPYTSTLDSTVGVVARLTPNGQLDSTFGTGGEVTLASTITLANSVAVEGNGRIVVAGILQLEDSGGTITSRDAALVGLTSTGGIDSTFGTNGLVTVPLAAPQTTAGAGVKALTVTGLQVAASGQILLGVHETNVQYNGPGAESFTLSRLSATGAIDTTFGTSGTRDLTSTILANDIVALPDGRIVLGGSSNHLSPDGFSVTSGGEVVRLLADGTPDPTFTVVATSTQGERFQQVVVGSDGAITALSYSGSRVYRYLATGLPDTSVGVAGRLAYRLPATSQLGSYQYSYLYNNALGVTADGKIVLGAARDVSYNDPSDNSYHQLSQSVLAQLQPTLLRDVTNDYDGGERSDLAAILPKYSVFAYRSTNASYGDNLISYGQSGSNSTAIPAPGDFDGDGRTDETVYDPTTGSFLFLNGSRAGTKAAFGAAGAGQSIPAPGDYDGDGKTDLAVYLPALGAFAIRPSSGGVDEIIGFGVTGAGNAIPAPGDYDGDGKTDLAIYLPQSGVLAYRPSGGKGGDVDVAFGAAGAGNAIPAPGDFDGDGKTDVAVYLPQTATFAYRSSAGKGDVLQSFGVVGAGNAIPVPGDYDADGTDDIAVYLPQVAAWVYRSSTGKGDVVQNFGAPGAGQTIPATVVVMSTGTVSTMSLPANASAAVPVYLADDQPGVLTNPKKPQV